MQTGDPRVDTSRPWPVTLVSMAPLPRQTAWRRTELAATDWQLPIDANCLAELDQVMHELRNHPVPTLLLEPAGFKLDACRALMARVKHLLDAGAGFAVLDRLPVATYSKEELTAIYWLLSQMIARPVAQAFKGSLLYDVWDTGQKTSTRVRADVTNEELGWHTDYGFNNPPPYIGLLVLRTARSGGASATASLHTAHEVLRQRDPALLQRLYQPYVWNRQGEHPKDAPICSANPIFSASGPALRARFNRRLQPVGYRLLGQEIDELGLTALDTLHDVLSEPENAFEFTLEAGQIEYLNNFRTAHRRTAFEDFDDPDLRRHLVRIFLRDEGRRSYMG